MIMIAAAKYVDSKMELSNGLKVTSIKREETIDFVPNYNIL